MLTADVLFEGVLNGLLAGGIYILVAVGLTLIYGVLHIINFAHGSMLMLAMYVVFWLWRLLGADPYLMLPLVAGGSFIFGFFLYRALIGRYSHGKDENILLITLSLSIIFENFALLFFGGDTRTIDIPYAAEFLEIGPAILPLPKIISFFVAILACITLGVWMTRSDTGKAIRAVAKERQGARLVGIDVEKIFAVSYGIGIACLGAAACLLMPTYYVTPASGNAFVVVAFTIVVLGGMGSFSGAAIGGLIIGVAESLGGLFLGEQLGQISISLIFILILLFKPAGLFGSRA